MPHEAGLIATIAVSFGLAFVLGLAATRVGMPPLVGYLLAGIMVGPFTPGFVADTGLAQQLAEIGVILLMFGVVPRAVECRHGRGARARAGRLDGALRTGELRHCRGTASHAGRH